MQEEQKSIFSKIIDRQIPANIVHETETLIAFYDIDPQAELHLLVVPKTAKYTNVAQLAAEEPILLAQMVATAELLAKKYSNGEFRLVFNSGASVGQTVFHVHAHVLSGQLAERFVNEN